MPLAPGSTEFVDAPRPLRTPPNREGRAAVVQVLSILVDVRNTNTGYTSNTFSNTTEYKIKECTIAHKYN